jgi:hypothetical protein
MSYALESGLVKDLAEARAAVARHGIVIARSIEADLVPAIMAEARASMEASPRKLAALDEDGLDRLMEKIRKTTRKSADELQDVYIRWLTKLGAGSPDSVLDDLEGVGQLFRWERISKAAEPASQLLVENGFRGIELAGPDDISDSLKVELEERWPPAFDRLCGLLAKAADESRKLEPEAAAPARTPKKKTAKKR